MTLIHDPHDPPAGHLARRLDAAGSGVGFRELVLCSQANAPRL